MVDLLGTLFPLAAGRSEDPDGGAGVLLIVGIIVAVVVVIGTAWFMVARVTSRKT